ncbi:MAG: peptidoglycan editing factor PgeF [Deltaproteobacteria bacterium]|nr:peptidoglycan editing factor PgeF [Deltaproteobacteria bacterium]
MQLTRQGKISYLKPQWVDRFPLWAGFSTRNGGISRPPFNSLNFGFNTDDAACNVERNRSTLCRAFDIAPQNLLTVQQAHGTDILAIDEPNDDLSHFLSLECDAVITNQPRIMLGILVADCFPVLFWHPGAGVIAAAHVGWRGAAGGLIGKVLEALAGLFRADGQGLYCAIGPGISAAHYEVDRTVKETFGPSGVGWEQIAWEKTFGRWRLDLGKCCRLQLEQGGVDPARIVYNPDFCTFAQRELFFSYRRDNGQTGRQIGFIMIK